MTQRAVGLAIGKLATDAESRLRLFADETRNIRREVLIVGLLLLMLVWPAAAQPPTIAEQPLVIEGRVLWIDFGSETLALEPATGGPAIMIDLHRIRQSDYHGFRGNEYVEVVGYILRPSRRIQAFQVYRVTPWFPIEPESP